MNPLVRIPWVFLRLLFYLTGSFNLLNLTLIPMARVIDILPEATGEEMIYLQNILKEMDDEKARTFANVYRARRREPMLILVTALLGFVAISGVHRFIIGHVGMGLLYFFTGGLCLIGTIVDVVNHQKLAFEYNQKVANEVLMMLH